uniref:HMG box domain-containing protein n=1 Tax=Romanomermis culicivorax TaxID=13658 RepID=A0A915JL70_ROMCU
MTPRRSSAINRSKMAKQVSLTGSSIKFKRTTTPKKKSVRRGKSTSAAVLASKKKSVAVKAGRKSLKVGGGSSKKTKGVKTSTKRRSSISPMKRTLIASKRKSCPPPRRSQNRRKMSSLAIINVSDSIESKERRHDEYDGEKTPRTAISAASPRAMFIDENKAMVRKHYRMNEKQTTDTLKDVWDYLQDNDNSIYHTYVNRTKSSGVNDNDVGDDRTSSFRDQSRRSNAEVLSPPPTTTVDGKSLKRESSGRHRSQSITKDPNKPKRALNAYMVFMLEVLPKVRKDMPKSSHKQHVKEIGKRWRNMSDVQKKSYSQEKNRKSHV